MHEGDQNTDNAKPDMQPEPVLHFARKATYKTPAQCIGGYQQYQAKGNNTELAKRIIIWAGIELRSKGGTIEQVDAPEDDQGEKQEKPVEP